MSRCCNLITVINNYMFKIIIKVVFSSGTQRERDRTILFQNFRMEWPFVCVFGYRDRVIQISCLVEELKRDEM